MKIRFLLFATLLLAFQFVAVNSIKAQSKQELEELMNSKSLAAEKVKPKKKSKKAQAEIVVQTPKSEAKPVAKTEPAKTEKKEEVKQEPKAEPKKEEAKPVLVEQKKEEPKPQPKTEPAKVEQKKEEPKPAVKPETAKVEKKEEPKSVVKKEPVKAEPKKEEPKPVAQPEPVKVEKKEEPKAEPVKAEQKTEVVKQEAVVAEPRSTEAKVQDELKTANGEKIKELPKPEAIGFGKNKKIGKKLFEQGSIYNGLKYYEAALAKKPKKTFINQPLADGSFLVRDYAAANKYYKTLVDLDSVKHKNLFALYQYALTEKYLGNYEVAKENFNMFNKLAKDKDEFAEQRKSANLEAQGCDLGISFRDSKDLLTYKTAHLGESINQQFTDYSPFLKDANTLYFGSWVSDKVILENKKEKYGTFSRIYKAIKKGNVWTKAEEAKGEVNTVQAHTGNAAFSEDGNTIYYTQCLQDEKQNMRCNIYRGKWTNEGWSAGEKLTAVNAEGFTSTHPALGKNEAGENVLYFASDRNASKGMDIFYSKINADGSLNKPQNLGNTINTKGDELTPFYDFKTNVLYFSSNGHINIGGTDIFKASAKNGEWTAPENLGMPVNSSVDDMYFMWNEQAELGFVVSNRTGGFGLKSVNCCDDIYQVELNKIYLAVKGVLTDADNKDEIITNCLLTLYDDVNGEEARMLYATDGTYLFDLEHDKEYKIIAGKKGFENMESLFQPWECEQMTL